MSIVNLDRDGVWCEIDTSAEKAWSTESTIGDTILINADSTVYDASAYVQADKTSTSISTGWRGIGCYIKQPTVDTTPYRVKGFINAGSMICSVGVGYAPASITGGDDSITPVTLFPMSYEFDQLIMVPARISTDTYYNRALAFFIALQYTGASADTYAHLSVQRLATSPPKFAASVS